MNIQYYLSRIFRCFRAGQQSPVFPGSAAYWERRYKTGGNSGSGSYGRLALFKASVINDFVERHRIRKVVELGCGDGNQLRLGNYPTYLGYDISTTAVERCRSLFQNDPSKRFLLYSADFQLENADLTMSLDVIFHLVEDSVFHAYMSKLFDCSTRFVIIYSSNESGNQIFHERTRLFTEWIKLHRQDFQLIQFIQNPYTYTADNEDNTSQSDFYIYERIVEKAI